MACNSLKTTADLHFARGVSMKLANGIRMLLGAYSMSAVFVRPSTPSFAAE
jgi:hypothetical protein